MQIINVFSLLQLKGFVGQPELLQRLNEEWDNLADPAFFLFRNDSKTVYQLRKYHFGNDEKEISWKDYQSLTNLVGDRLFSMPVRDAAFLHAMHHKHHDNSSTFIYFYNEKPDISFGDFLSYFNTKSVIPRVIQAGIQILQFQVQNWLGLERFDYGKQTITNNI